MGTVNDFFVYLVKDFNFFFNANETKIIVTQEGLNGYEKYLLSFYCREVLGIVDIYYQEGDKSI